MERAERHQERMNAPVPDDEVVDDSLTRSALDPTARVADMSPGRSETGAPQLVDPTRTENASEGDDGDEEGDDYDSWSKSELENEVTARDALEGTSDVSVVGTGNNGNVLKPDLVKGLRLWDQENPGALG